MAAYIDFTDLKERVAIDKVVQLFGLQMTKSGAQLRSACWSCARYYVRGLPFRTSAPIEDADSETEES
jgi:hypothetical protein